jgi:hypothetical protein
MIAQVGYSVDSSYLAFYLGLVYRTLEWMKLLATFHFAFHISQSRS